MIRLWSTKGAAMTHFNLHSYSFAAVILLQLTFLGNAHPVLKGLPAAKHPFRSHPQKSFFMQKKGNFKFQKSNFPTKPPAGNSSIPKPAIKLNIGNPTIDNVLANPVAFGDIATDIEINNLIMKLNKNKTFLADQECRQILFTLKTNWASVPPQERKTTCDQIYTLVQSRTEGTEEHKAIISEQNRMGLLGNTVHTIFTLAKAYNLFRELKNDNGPLGHQAPIHAKTALAVQVLSLTLSGKRVLADFFKSAKTELDGNKQLCIPTALQKPEIALYGLLQMISSGSEITKGCTNIQSNTPWATARTFGCGLYSLVCGIAQLAGLSSTPQPSTP
jgi:hypothetical protein